MEQYFRQAIENIARFGDTDVFPLPVENHILYDESDEVVDLLKALHGEFQDALDRESPTNVSSVAMIGYTAFRGVMQIDPLWNLSAGARALPR